MTTNKQVRAKYDYWFENKPDTTKSLDNHHTYKVKSESLPDVIRRLKQLVKSRAESAIQEHYGNMAAGFERAFVAECDNSSNLAKKHVIAGEILAGDMKKHHKDFLKESIKEKKDFKHLIITAKVYQPAGSDLDFTIELPCNLNELYPTPQYNIEKAMALAGLGDLKEFLHNAKQIDMSGMEPAVQCNGLPLEIKLIDEGDLDSIVSDAVAESYEVLFEYHKGRDVSFQIENKASLLRRLRELMIDFEKSDAIPEEKSEKTDEQFKSELVDLVETRKRNVIYLFNQKEVKRTELPVFVTENDSILLDIASKDDSIMQAINGNKSSIGEWQQISGIRIVLKNDDVIICVVEVSEALAGLDKDTSGGQKTPS